MQKRTEYVLTEQEYKEIKKEIESIESMIEIMMRNKKYPEDTIKEVFSKIVSVDFRLEEME